MYIVGFLSLGAAINNFSSFLMIYNDQSSLSWSLLSPLTGGIVGVGVSILLFISGYGILASRRWAFYMGLVLSVFIILATIIPVLMNPSIVEMAPLWMNLISWGTFCLSLIIIFCLFLLRTEFLVAKTNEK
jgi:uncharacterized membrane protein (DUF2068 family)